MGRVLSGLQPTGELHIGNYIGALRQFVDQPGHYYCVVDLHSLTVEHDPTSLHARTLDLAALLVALGMGQQSAVFIQSQVPAHTEMTWLLACEARIGELNRMTQFKAKGRNRPQSSVGLFLYPVLMAADILLYDIAEVPVGDDQRQHLELIRDIAMRLNSHYGDVVVVPQAVIPKLGGRVFSLTDPTQKMSKTDPDPMSKVLLTDSDQLIAKKIKAAVTDSGRQVSHDPVAKPGISNLLEMAAVLSGEPVASWVERYRDSGYGAFKQAVADQVVAVVGPLRDEAARIRQDASELERVLEIGRARAAEQAERRLGAVKRAIGLHLTGGSA
ncbi:MAG: tryptophan--tRNA ligase [Sulfobacillus sp.]